MASTPRPARMVKADEDQVTTTLELFFDLVFVFAITQVTDFVAHEPSGRGSLRGLLIIGIIWWCWVCYSWLGNVVRADEGLTRLGMFVGMGGMFVIAQTIPEAFHDFEGGLSGPAVFAIGYLVVRAVHIWLFVLVSQDDPGLRRQVLMFSATTAVSTLLLLGAAFVHGATVELFWIAVLLVDYGGTLLMGYKGWRVRSPKHFAERHGLIIIVALGESIVAIGVGVAEHAISWPIVIAIALGLSVSGSLWWAYFDAYALRAEHRFSRLHGHPRVALAQHAYTYLHLPMVAGIVFIALGLKKVLEYVSDTEHHTLSDPLHGVPLYALLGGAVAFCVAHEAFALRAGSHVGVARIPAIAALLVLIALGQHLPALATLAVMAGVLAVLNVWESIRDAEERHEIRHAHS